MENSHFSNNGRIKNLIATIYWKLGDEDNAFIYLQQAVAYEPHLADAKFNLAILMEKRGDALNAKIFLEDILDWEPRHYNTLVHLGIIEARNNDYDLSAEYLKRARGIKNTDLKVTYNLANVYIKQGKFDDAIPLLEEACEGEPTNVKMLQKLMVCLGKTDNYEKLERVCKNIISLDKSNSKALAYLARAFKENNKLNQLEKLLQKIDDKIEKFSNKSNKKDVVMKIKSKLREKLSEVKNMMFLRQNEEEDYSQEEKELPVMNIMKLEADVEDPNIVKHKEVLEKNPYQRDSLFYVANYEYKVRVLKGRTITMTQPSAYILRFLKMSRISMKTKLGRR